MRRFLFLPTVVSTILLGACSAGSGTTPISSLPRTGDGVLQPQFAVGARLKYKIYVASYGNSTVTTYKANGTETTPTITAGLS